jgi:glycosyltransferase involved in cell wall biosynthesis
MPVATERGGAEATLLSLLRHSPPDARWRVLFLEEGPMVAKAQELGAESGVVPVGRLRDVREIVRPVRAIATAARAWRPDVALSWMTKAHVYTAPAAAARRLPAVWFQHGMPSRTDPIDRVATLLPARAILAPSRTVATAQAALWPHRVVRVAYPGVELPDDAAVAGDDPLAQVPIPPGAAVVGLVARLQRWKGVHVLIEALPHVLARRPEAHVVVVGGDHPLEPGYRDELLALAGGLGIADRVHFAGYQPDAQRWMACFDVVVHASDTEPFGLVPLEAMALGKPLVAGAAGGPAEVVCDGEDGFLVAFGDAAGIADRILRYLEDPQLAARMGAAAARRAAEFGVQRFAHEVVATLESVRSADGARRGAGSGSIRSRRC